MALNFNSSILKVSNSYLNWSSPFILNVKKHCVWQTHIACLFHKCHWILILGLWVINIVTDLETNIWSCVSVCLCVYAFYMCLDVCSMSVAVLGYSLFFETRSLSGWTWYSPIQLDWQTNNSQGSSVTTSLELEL